LTVFPGELSNGLRVIFGVLASGLAESADAEIERGTARIDAMYIVAIIRAT